MFVQQLTPLVISTRSDFASKVLASGQPAVIAGAARDWPATKAWTLERLAQKFAEVELPVRLSDDEFAVFFGASKGSRSLQKMRLADYLGAIENVESAGRRPPYAGSLDILRDPALAPQLGSLLAACPFPDWMPRRDTDEYRIWIGAKGQRSTIHNDSYYNFNVQIIGRKRFLLFSPEQHSLLYPEFLHRGLWSSPIDHDALDLALYPGFARARGIVCELAPGDMLFIPRFWWHSAEAITTSLNVNRWVFEPSTTTPWWHQQPEVRSVIDYHGLRERLQREHLELEPEARVKNQASFELLDHDLGRLAAQCALVAPP